MALNGVLVLLFLELLIFPVFLCTQESQGILSYNEETVLQLLQVVFKTSRKSLTFDIHWNKLDT